MATIYKRNGSWSLDWRDAAGRHRVSLGRITKAAATAALHSQELALHGLGHLAPQAESTAPTLSGFAGDYLKWYQSHYTTSYYRVRKIVELVLVPAFGDTPLDLITPKAANDWKLQRSTEFSRRRVNGRQALLRPESVNKELRQLRALLAAAVSWEIIPRHPWPERAVQQIKDLTSRPPPYYTGAQLSRLFKHSSDETRWWWQLFVNTGMRKAEGFHLRKEHITRKTLRILSEPGARTKSAKWRMVPLNAAAVEALKHIRFDDYVLPRWHENSIGRAFAREAKAAGLPGSLHWLRHTFCSHLAMNGVPVGTIKELAGHASITTTENYMHLSPGHITTAVNSLDFKN